MSARVACCLLFFAAVLSAADEYTYWIDECTPEAARATACDANDTELGQWAFAAWQRESNGAVTFRKSASAAHARIAIHWANGVTSLYGETVPLVVDGRPGAAIYVLPDPRGLGPGIYRATSGDRLLRDAVVYLTFLHESGHVLGLNHTKEFGDIMYSFQNGGDIVEYFERYRRLLKTRGDIAAHSGISDADRQALRLALR